MYQCMYVYVLSSSSFRLLSRPQRRTSPDNKTLSLLHLITQNHHSRLFHPSTALLKVHIFPFFHPNSSLLIQKHLLLCYNCEPIVSVSTLIHQTGYGLARSCSTI
ncbi:hypothetical protein QVD17_01875 [Tagetes erecta]|uniref:Uncharacterized protein n=1 Tax=Tagetes erecta TaxID=13708 RepID=A0AAD8L5L2_TARER|nr:hypothetical protein QVD17_01875 [Tagetes erecta]